MGEITDDTYIGDVWNDQDPQVQSALKESGLYDVLKPMMADEQWGAISANMPLRSLAATGVEEETREKFMKLVK